VIEFVRSTTAWTQALSRLSSVRVIPDLEEIRLSICSHDLVISFLPTRAFVGFDGRNQTFCYRAGFARPGVFDLRLPSADAAGSQIKHAILQVPASFEFGNFLLSAGCAFFALTAAFSAVPDWAILGLSWRHSFHLIYRRRFTILALFRGVRLFGFTIPISYPNWCLLTALRGLAFRVSPGPPAKQRIVLLHADQLADARERLAATADLIIFLEEHGFLYVSQPDEFQRDFSQPSLFARFLGAVSIRAAILDGKLSFEIERDEQRTAVLAEFGREAANPMEWALAFTGLVEAFLAVDAELFRLTVDILAKLKAELALALPDVYAAMQTAGIGVDGSAAVSVVIAGKNVEIGLAGPFRASGQIQLRVNGVPETVSGINGLMAALQPSLFEFGDL
jgi:hypothetical protein